MVGDGKESFWFPLATGTIGGLIMSIVGIFFYLPVFCLKRPERTRPERHRRSFSERNRPDSNKQASRDIGSVEKTVILRYDSRHDGCPVRRTC